MNHLPNYFLSCSLLAYPCLALADDNSESHTQVTDSQGTTLRADTSQKSSVSSNGTVKSHVDEKITRDPKGLLNKTTETYHAEKKIKPNGESYEKREAVNASGTKEQVIDQKKISRRLGGGKTITTTHREVVDPKGLMNKHTAEVKEEVKTDSKGEEQKITTSAEIDGKKVAEGEAVTK